MNYLRRIVAYIILIVTTSTLMAISKLTDIYYTDNNWWATWTAEMGQRKWWIITLGAIHIGSFILFILLLIGKITKTLDEDYTLAQIARQAIIVSCGFCVFGVLIANDIMLFVLISIVILALVIIFIWEIFKLPAKAIINPLKKLGNVLKKAVGDFVD